jgi:murein DD-endopeptidase MepM/ murein hydrolase activator NlpD
MEKKGVLGSLKFIFSTTFLLVLMFCAVVVTVLNTYRPTLKVTINDKFIGYFKSEEEFEEVYVTLVAEKEQVDPNVKVYLDAEPVFTEAYIRGNLISSQNVYTNLRAEVRTEYTIYNVVVKGEKKMTFNNQDQANKYLAELKKELPKVQSEITVEKVADLGEMTSLEVANNIFKDIVSRNKPVVRTQPVIKTTSTYATVSAATANVAAAQGGVWPTVERRINAHFGWYQFGRHTGIDIGGAVGTPIYAYKSGLVVFAGWYGNYGYLLKVDHGNGVKTYYAHCKELLVSAGDTVEMGQVIAKIGLTGFTTGSHLHFEIRINDTAVNPYGYIAGK